MNDKLSQLVDDELDAGAAEDLLDALGNDADLRDRWHRYHLIGAVMRNEWEASVHPTQLAQRISDGVAAETPIPAVRPAARPAWGMALAASVALVGLLGWYSYSPAPEAVPQVAEAPRTEPLPVVRVAEEPAVAVSAQPAPDGTRWETLSPDQVRKLNAYLVEHGEFASMRGLSGVTAYARFVSNDD